jgi:hypothetical protein
MGMGLLTLSINQVNPRVEDSFHSNNGEESDHIIVTTKISNKNTPNSIKVHSAILIPSLIQTPIMYHLFHFTLNNFNTVTELKQAKLPIYELQEDGYPEITDFIQDYYAAKISCDMDKLKGMSTNPSAVITKDNLQSLTEGIEDYSNIKCYTKKSMVEGAYIVYAFHEIKFIGIDTPAPALSSIYLVTDEKGKLKIYDNEMDEELRSYYIARKEDSDVKELIEMTNEMSEEAKAKDKDLNYFWDIIDNY